MSAAVELNLPAMPGSALDLPNEWVRAFAHARALENKVRELPPGTTSYEIVDGWI